jgi:hypothetical protein
LFFANSNYIKKRYLTTLFAEPQLHLVSGWSELLVWSIILAMELRVGNKYRLGRKIGSGSFGDIYLG